MSQKYITISDLSEIYNLDNVKLLINKYLKNGNYYLNTIDIKDFSEQLSSKNNYTYYISDKDIQNQLSIIDNEINTKINSISTDINNISAINDISAYLSDTYLSDELCANNIYNLFKDIDETAISNISEVENSINILQNSEAILEAFNATFNSINFSNVEKVNTKHDEISLLLSTLSTTNNYISSSISSALLSNNEKLQQYTSTISNLNDLINEVNEKINKLSSMLSTSILLSYTVDIPNENDTFTFSILAADKFYIKQFINCYVYKKIDNDQYELVNDIISSIDSELSNITDNSTSITGEITFKTSIDTNYRIILHYIQNPNLSLLNQEQ